MPLTEPPQGKVSKPSLMDVTYEDVRQSFLIRLHGEEARLEWLRADLACAQVCPAPAFAALQVFAHRLRGAAAVFNFPEIRDAAKRLELAAGVATAENSPVGDPVVQKAVQILATRLAFVNGLTPSLTAEVPSAPAN